MYNALAVAVVQGAESVELRAQKINVLHAEPRDFPGGGGVSELRIAYGPGLRIYFKRVNDIAVLLCGGDKASQRRYIETAKLLAENLENMEDIWRR